jgi:hypothetical protein
MFAIDQDKTGASSGQILKDHISALLQQLTAIDDRVGVRKLFCWLQDEGRRKALLRELNGLNDECLNDMGLKRPLDPRADDLVKRLRAGG